MKLRSARLVVSGERDGFSQGCRESAAVELENVCVRDLLPDGGLRAWIGLERDRALQKADGVLQLVAPDGEGCSASQPGDGASAQAGHLAVVVWPSKVDALGMDGLRVVVGQ